jgi:Histidine-specific methyltransferase, SAM-dependent
LGKVVDFSKKEGAIKTLLNARTVPQILCAVIARNSPAFDNIKACWRTWKDHAPTHANQRAFIDALLIKIGIPGKGCEWFVKCNYSEFAESLPPASQVLIGHTTKRKSGSLHRILSSPLVSTTAMLDLLKQQFIEQKVCYITPRSARAWYDFLNAPRYGQNIQCRKSLQSLLTGEQWKTTINQNNFLGSVMLGGGSVEKDRDIVVGMLSQTSRQDLSYAIVDYSDLMIQETLNGLDIYSEQLTDRVDLYGVKCDFYELPGHARDFRSRDGVIAWFIPGGTLGNLDEDRFLSSLRDSSKVGDIFSVGVDLVPQSVDSFFEERLKDKYRAGYVKNFFRDALLTSWEGNIGHSAALEALAVSEPELVRGAVSCYSCVPNSVTLHLTAKTSGMNSVLLTSTRYSESELVTFIEKYGFSHVESFAAEPENEFKQLLFRRTTKFA